MEQLPTIILVVVIFAVALIFLWKTGVLLDLATTFCVAITSLGTTIRSILINSIYPVVTAIWGVLTGMLWSSQVCWNPYGAVGCVVVNGIMTQGMIDGTRTLIGSIPLLTITPPQQYLGITKDSEVKQLPTKDEVMKRISENLIDCWRMFGGNKYNPLTLKDPPNPRTCFISQIVINASDFSLSSPISDFLTKNSIVNWMETHEYPSGKKCSLSSGTIVCAHSYKDEFNSVSDTHLSSALKTLSVSWDYKTIGQIDHTCYGNYCSHGVYRTTIFIKYLDYYEVAPLLTEIKSNCYDSDCGYNNGECNTDHDLVVLCGKSP